MVKSKRVFISDCEGPISKNDNAYELSCQIIPRGDKLFPVVSKYDDVQADVVKKPGYKAGDTLKLILPFFKAFGATDEMMKKFSSKNIILIPEIVNTLGIIDSVGQSYIVSTSYEHYIRSLCDEIGFPFNKTYSTRLKLDSYEIKSNEKTKLQEVSREIAEMPLMEIPSGSNSLQNFSTRDRRNIERLDEIFWKDIPKMKIGRVLKEVNPIGGYEKANAIDDITKKLNIGLPDVMYVGDSITDVDAFRKVKTGGGLAVSFNGNNYAVREAEIGVTSQNSRAMTNIAMDFLLGGKEKVIDHFKDYPRVEVLTEQNREEFSGYSSKFRKTVRGKSIGKLG